MDCKEEEIENSEKQLVQSDDDQVDQNDVEQKKKYKRWSKEEDEALLKIKEQHGDTSWTFISKEMD